MVPSKLEVEAESEFSTTSEWMSITSESSSSSLRRNQDIRNRGAEPKRKVKKLRSIKLTRLPSRKISARQANFQSDYDAIISSSDATGSHHSTPIQVSDASPNYAKNTTCSDERKENFQKSVRTLTRRSSFKPVKSLSRLSSTKLRRPLARKSCGGTDLKKLKKTRSIMVATDGVSRLPRREMISRHSQLPVNSSSEVDSSPNYLRATSCSDVMEVHFQASPRNSESSFNSSAQNGENSKTPRPNSASYRSVRVLTRKSTLRPLRIITKMASFKSMGSSVENCSRVSEILDSSKHKATCSSTLKDSKFPNHVELQPGGSESDGTSVMKVCPYSYCSLHGHRHAASPPLKRFVSMRRRMLKTQKSMKPASQSPLTTKCSGTRKKGIQKTNNDSPHFASGTEKKSRTGIRGPKVDSNGVGTHDGDDKNKNDFMHLNEIMLGEASHPHPNFKDNLHQVSDFHLAELHTPATSPALQEKNMECCCIKTELHETVSEASDADGKEKGNIASNPLNVGNESTHSNDCPEYANFSLSEVRNPRHYDKLSSKPDDIVKPRHEEVPVDGEVQQEMNDDTTISCLDLGEDKGNSHSGLKNVEANTPPGDLEPICTNDLAYRTNTEKQKNLGLWHLIYQRMASGIAVGNETKPPLDAVGKNQQVEHDHMLLGMNDSNSNQNDSGIHQSMGIQDHDTGNQRIELYRIDAIKLVQEAFDKILSEIQDQSLDDQSITSDITSDQEILEKNICDGEELSISASSDSSTDGTEKMLLKVDTINNPEEVKEASKAGYKSNQQMPKNWSNLKKIIILKRFVKALENVRNFNPRKPRYLPVELDPEAEKVHLRHKTMEERKNADQWMLDYALRQVISTLGPAQKRKVALLVQAFETVIPPPEVENHLKSDAAASSHATPVKAITGSSRQSGGETKEQILPCKTSYPETSFREILDQDGDFQTAEKHIPPTCSELKETNSEWCCNGTASKTAFETTETDLKGKENAAFNLENGDNDSIIFLGDQSSLAEVCPQDHEAHGFCDNPSLEFIDIATTSGEEFPVNMEIFKGVQKDTTLNSNSGVSVGGSGCTSKMLESNNVTNATGERSDKPKHPVPENYVESISNITELSSAMAHKPLAGPTTTSAEEVKPKYGFFKQFPQVEESHSSQPIDVAHETQSHMRLWYVVYKHMVTSSPVNDGSQLLLERTDKGGEMKDASTLPGMNNATSSRGFSGMDKGTNVENHDAGSQEVDLQQIEIIKLVEEAIDEIPLPEIQDDAPDAHSTTDKITPNQELLKQKHGAGVDLFSSTSSDPVKDRPGDSDTEKAEHSTMPNSEETQLNSNNITNQKDFTSVKTVGNKSRLQSQKSWSNLKKFILLKRFIKSLEKVKKINPREPRHLTLDPDTEAEKVNLRHQDTEDRKNAEEWMLDYALQQVVSKLTPARKRKVGLLVEAFETIMPTIATGSST